MFLPKIMIRSGSLIRDILMTSPFNAIKTGIGEAIAIFWTINDPAGFQGFKDGDREGYSNFLDHKRTTRPPRDYAIAFRAFRKH